MSQLEELMDHIKNISEEYAEQLPPDGDWEHMVFATKGDHIYTGLLQMPPNGPLREELWETHLPNAIRKTVADPEMIVLLTSTWYLEMEEMEETNLMPSEHHNRKEALVIQGVSQDEELTYFAEIKRSENHPELEWQEQPGGITGRAIASLRRAVWT